MLSQLPDLAILCVFDYLSIGDIHNTIESYPQFESLVSLALRRRKCLTLIGGKSNMSQLSPYHAPPLMPKSYSNIYKLDHLLMSHPNLLFRTFPRVSTLNVHLAEQVNLEGTIVRMCYLIDQWSDQLVNLKLSFSFVEPCGNITAMLDSINRLPTLKTLDLDMNDFSVSDETIDLPILSRLEQFYFLSYNDASLIIDSLKRYAQPNTNLRQIGIDLIYGHAYKYIHEFSPEFCARFTHFNMMGNLEGYQLDTFTSLFRSLVTICTFPLCDLDPVNCSIIDLVHHLSPLSQLKSLHMKLVLIPQKPTLEQLVTLPQFPSVKFIELIIGIDDHCALEPLCLDYLFPNLESIKIIYETRHCWECDIDSHRSTEGQLLKCVTQRLQPLRKCSQLGKISAHIRTREWLNWSWSL